MARLVHRAHELVQACVRPGDWCIDATLGNGHDTLALCQLVGPTGHVWGCDIQPSALCETARRLLQLPYDNATLVACDHRDLERFLPPEVRGRIAAVMMNLGFLPGGELPICTQVPSTVAAIANLISLLKPGGIATIIAYNGHAGGVEETAAVARLVERLAEGGFRTHGELPASLGGPSPQLFAIWREVSQFDVSKS